MSNLNDSLDRVAEVKSSIPSLADFIVIKKIGEGAYSSVWKVRRK